MPTEAARKSCEGLSISYLSSGCDQNGSSTSAVRLSAASEAGVRGEMGGPTEKQVVAVKSVTGCGAEDWNSSRFLPGDAIDQLRVVGKIMLIANAPFTGGKSALQRELRKIYQAGETAVVRVKRGGTKLELRACVVAEESMMRKKIYLLADSNQKNYVAYLMDAAEEECLALQDHTQKLLEKHKKSCVAYSSMKDCLISYPWQAKMQQFLPSPNSAMVFSLILMPFQCNNSGTDDGNLEGTTARAMAWLSAAQSSGVPIIFVNIQSEPLFLQCSTSKYFGSGATEDPLEMVNSGIYTLHELEGTEINVTRALRLWYSPPEGELAVTLKPKDSEARLGVNISCTEEGFCYVSSVDAGTAAERAGLGRIYEAACTAKKLLVVSRVAGEKITPWFVSSSGAIRCFNATSISDKIAAHRQASQPIEFYFMVWTGATNVKPGGRKSEEKIPETNTETQIISVDSRYSVSSESDKFFDSSGSGQSLAAEPVAHTSGWELTPAQVEAVPRTSSTRSFSFHDSPTQEINGMSNRGNNTQQTGNTNLDSEEFSFTL